LFKVCRLENEKIAGQKKNDKDKDDMNEKLRDLVRDLSEFRKNFEENLKGKNSDLESVKKVMASEKRDMQGKIEGYIIAWSYQQTRNFSGKIQVDSQATRGKGS
jgi:hypothetical protein